MTTDFSTPLLDNDGKLRLRRFAIATISSAIVIASAVAVALHSADPGGGWGVALGVGAMVGFWMCPLAGAVVGNGFHEIMKDKAKAEAATQAAAPASSEDAGSTAGSLLGERHAVPA